MSGWRRTRLTEKWLDEDDRTRPTEKCKDDTELDQMKNVRMTELDQMKNVRMTELDQLKKCPDDTELDKLKNGRFSTHQLETVKGNYKLL